MILSRAQRWVMADQVMTYIDSCGEPTSQDGDRFIEYMMEVGGVEFRHIYSRDPNGGVSLHDMTLETSTWKLTGTVGPSYLVFEVTGDAEQCDRDLMAVMLSGEIESGLEPWRLEQAEDGLKQSLLDPVPWGRAKSVVK